MFSVLIVDDEKWMRNTVVRAINWEKEGFKVVGEACDGSEALDLIRKIEPDIVLADIQMPGLDGITLLKRAKEIGTSPVFIFFSGYDRFDYAQNAVNLGAMGYILKPVDEDELLKMLFKAREHIMEVRENKESKEKLSNFSEQELRRSQKELIARLLYGNKANGSDVDAEIQHLDLNLKGEYFVVIIAAVDNFTDLIKITNVEPPRIISEFNKIANNIFSEYGFPGYVLDRHGGLDIILTFSTVAEMQSIEAACNRIKDELKRRMSFTVTFGIGGGVQGFRNIHQSYREAQQAIAYRILKGNDRVISYQNLAAKVTPTTILDTDLEKIIIDGIEKCDFLSIAGIIEKIKIRLQTETVNLDDLKNFNYHFLELIYQVCNKMGIIVETVFDNIHVVCDELDEYEDMEQYLGRIERILTSSLEVFTASEMTYYGKLIANIKKYLDEHYMEEMSLESVAQEFSFHPNYFSKLFKEETGCNFIDYLTDLRIKIARDLLKDVKYSILEVATMVGYREARYFTKVFKKVVGLTPSEYIRK